jgi:LysM repeat protein
MMPGQAARVPGRVLRRRRRRRRLMRLAVFIVILLVAIWAGVRVAHAGVDGAIYTGARYQVRSGDTLWGIAARHYGSQADLRRVVFDIRQSNGLQGATVQPGETLRLPYEGQ